MALQSQKQHSEVLYPSDFSEEDKLNYDMLFSQSCQLFPKLAEKDEWSIKLAVLAYMKKLKLGERYQPATPEEIQRVKDLYVNDDAVYFTPPYEKPENYAPKEETPKEEIEVKS